MTTTLPSHDERLRSRTAHPSVFEALQRHHDIAESTAIQSQLDAERIDHPALAQYVAHQGAYAQGIAEYVAWLKGGESTTALAALLEV